MHAFLSLLHRESYDAQGTAPPLCSAQCGSRRLSVCTPLLFHTSLSMLRWTLRSSSGHCVQVVEEEEGKV